MEKLRAQIRQIDGITIVDMAGDLNGQSEPVFDDAIEQVEHTNPLGILLNFSQIDYINSTGIGLVVRLLNQARKTGHPVAAFGVKSYYVKIFEYTRISQYMNIHPDEYTALSALTSSAAA